MRRLDRLSHARVVQDERRTWALGERHSGALFSWRAWVALPHDLGVSPGRTTWKKGRGSAECKDQLVHSCYRRKLNRLGRKGEDLALLAGCDAERQEEHRH